MDLPLVEHPWFLVPALVILLAGILSWLFRPGSISRLTHAVVLCLLLLTLAEPHIDHSSPVGSITAIVDVSQSMRPELGQKLLDKLSAYKDAGLEVRLKPFSETAAAFLTEETNFESLQKHFQGLSTEKTNLAEALSSLPPQSSVLLLSDGYPNQGGAVAPGQGKIYPLTLPESDGRSDLELTQLIVPLRAPKESSLPIRTSIKNHANETKSGLLTVSAGTKILFKSQITVEPQAERVFEYSTESSSELESITVRLEQQAGKLPVEQLQEKRAFVTPSVRDSILLLSGSEEDQTYLKKVFQDESFELKSSVGNVPQALFSEIQKAKAVVLNNISLDLLGGEERARLLAEAVRKGVGLVTVGGPKSYGLGGYRGSALESVLAVVPLPPQQKEKRLNVAVELIIDKSRSMADENRLESAKEASREVIRNLKDDDFVGVIGFDTTPFEVVRLGQVGQIREQALERVGRLFPAARTNLFPSLEEGRRRLEVAPASRKHMIVMTDGKIPDADDSYKTLVQSMRLLGITLSTVLVSGESDFGFLEELANIGGGTFYQTADASNLPRIFMQDIRVRSGEQSLKEQQSYAVSVTGEGSLITSLQDFPSLRGFVETDKAKDSHIQLTVRDGSVSKPLLAEKMAGAGRSIAFTSDANGRWSNLWISWSDFRKFWFDIIQRASRPSENRNGRLKYEVESSQQNGMLTLWVTTYGGVPQQLPELSLTYENGKRQKVSMAAEAKGRFSVAIVPESMGKLLIDPIFDSTEYPGVALYIDPQNYMENPYRGTNNEFLTALAASSGGVINPDPKVLLVSEGHEVSYLYRPLLLAALLVYLVSLAFRQVLQRRNK